MTDDNPCWLITRLYYRRSVYSIGKRESNMAECKSHVEHVRIGGATLGSDRSARV